MVSVLSSAGSRRRVCPDVRVLAKHFAYSKVRAKLISRYRLPVSPARQHVLNHITVADSAIPDALTDIVLRKCDYL